METVLRRLRLKRGDSQESDARKRLQKELFGFASVCSYVHNMFLMLTHNYWYMYFCMVLFRVCTQKNQTVVDQ